MKTLLLALVLSASLVASRAGANPCCWGEGYDGGSWDLDIDIDMRVVVGVLALGAADVTILITDAAFAYAGKRVPAGYAVFELLVAVPNLTLGLMGEGTGADLLVGLGAGMAAHGILSLAWPRTERAVSVQPAMVGASGYGVGVAGHF